MRITGTNRANIFRCDTCIKGKIIQFCERLPDKKANKVLLHSDLVFPFAARESFKYAMAFIDDFSIQYNTNLY